MKKVLLCFFLFSIVAATPIKDKWIPDSIYPYSDSLQTIVKITDTTWGTVINTITVISLIDGKYILTHKNKPNRTFESHNVRDIEFLKTNLDLDTL
jgi:hypothetical protein